MTGFGNSRSLSVIGLTTTGMIDSFNVTNVKSLCPFLLLILFSVLLFVRVEFLKTTLVIVPGNSERRNAWNPDRWIGN